MDSCVFACDLILSAIKLSKFAIAKKLCEILLITDRNKFSLLYGIVNIALKNYHLSRTICSSNSFRAGLIKAVNSETWEGLQLEVADSEKLIQKLENELIDNSNLLRRMFSDHLKITRSVAEIESIVEEFNSFTKITSNLNTEELSKMKLVSSNFNESPALHLAMAQIFLCRSEYALAKIHYERAFSLNPYSLEGYDQYSTILWHLNKKDELFALFLKFKAEHFNTSQYYIIRGNYFSFTGANEKAIQSFRQAIEADSSASYALFLEGHDWLSLNNIDEAEKSFEKLSRLDPDSFMPYFGLGIVNYKKKKFERAISFLNLAKSINPFNYNIKCYCSIVLESLDQRSEALAALLDENQHLSSIIYYRKAKLYDSMNLFREAEIVLKEAIGKFPNDPALHFSLAEIYHSKGQISAAVKLLKRANELELNNPATKEFINNIDF